MPHKENCANKVNCVFVDDLLGVKVCIIGPSSSGKSTLATKIAKRKSLALLHLDQIAFLPNSDWERTSLKEMGKKHDEFILRDRWVIDGNYSHFFHQRFSKADTLIFIKMNRIGCVLRFIMRELNKKQRYGKLEGAKFKVSWSMIKYILFGAPKKAKEFDNIIKKYPHLNVIVLRSFQDINKLEI